MVEFMGGFNPAYEPAQPVKATEDVTFDIEKPIIPISEIGTTVIDQGNVLQNLENNIRMGTKKIQLILSGGGGGVSSFASSFGKDVRRAMYEKAKATGVEITGLEMSPQMMQGLSGIDRQSGRMTEEARQRDLNSVRDAIRFAADVSRGGGIDIYSQEYQRDILDAEWNKDDQGKPIFFDYSQKELDPKNTEARRNITKYLLDKRTGAPIRESVVHKEELTKEIKYATAKDLGLVGKKDAKGNVLKADDYVDLYNNKISESDSDFYSRRVPVMDDQGRFQVVETPWTDMEKRRDEYNKANAKVLAAEGRGPLSTEEFLYRQRLEAQQALVRGQALHYGHDIDVMQAQLRELNGMKKTAADITRGMDAEGRREWIRDTLLPRLGMEGLPPSERDKLLDKGTEEIINQQIKRQENRMRGFQEQALSYRLQEAELEEIKKNIVTPKKFAEGKVFDSYSEMGIEAMQVTKERKLPKPIYIGPEIGMASEMYGGHPREFIELIKKSREEMSVKLMARGMDKSSADEAAKTHIKGMMDTSHMMMWYKHFARKPGESDEKHIKRFNEWLIGETRNMVKEGVVGGVQVVDTITGDHAHLPAGQGAFDVVGMVKAMKEEGFKGDIISEGHSEDTMGFGQGRILTETWRAFGAPVGNYARGQRGGLRTWGGIQQSYFGYTNPTTHIVGAYVPSNEWSLWSEVPFE